MNYSAGNIYFETPDYRKLAKDGWAFFDMHNHTAYSDGFSTVHEMIKKAKQHGYGISITDHNEIKGSLIACRAYKKCIPGIEVTAKEMKDYLFYFYNAEELKRFYKDVVEGRKGRNIVTIKTDIPTERLVQAQKEYECIMSIAHPGGIFKNNLEWLAKHSFIKKVQALEAFNGSFGMGRNLRTFGLIKKHKKAMTAGSDAHRLKESGKVLCVSHAKGNDEFLDSIRKRKNFVLGQPIMLEHQLFRAKIFVKHVGRAFTQAERILTKKA